MNKALPFLCLLTLPVQTLAADNKPAARIVEEKTRYGDISYPLLSGLADKNIETSINTLIKEQVATWNCDFDGERESVDGLDYNAWSDVKLIDAHHFSYTVSKDYFCGGAHPNQQIDTYTYDLRTGAPVSIGGLLVPELLDEKLTAFLIKDHRFEEDGCGDAYVDINWDYYRTAKDIVFLPRLPGHSPTCWEEFPVPIETLKPYMWSELEEDRD